MSVIGWMWWDAFHFHIQCPCPCPTFLPVYLFTCLPVYLSLAERRSVVIGSCWIVWCSIRANSPARLVMAILRFLSCSNSSSSLYHWQTDTQTDYSLDRRRRRPVAVDKVLLPHHTDSLQVDLCAAQLLPAVVLVALSLGDAAELPRGLKHVLHQRAAAHLVSWDLSGRSGARRNTRRGVLGNISQHWRFFICTEKVRPQTNLWVSGMFRTQNLQPLAVGFTLRVVDVAKEAGRPERQTGVRLTTDRQAGSHTA